MFINNPELINPIKVYDTLVVGSGPVGITLAIQLAEGGQKVLLLEGGSEDYTEESQNRYSGKMTGLDWSKFKYMDGLRLRYLGGTSNHWVGYCVQLDETDLEKWPLSYSELYRNSEIAEIILEIQSFKDANAFLSKDKTGYTRRPLLHAPRPIMRSPPVRFKSKYRTQLESHPNITICLNANLVSINLTKDLNSIESIEVKASPISRRVKILVNKIALCMGAIECTRFMLLLQKKYPGKRNWNTKLVGKNFLEHPHFDWDDAIAYCISPKGSLERNNIAIDKPFTEQKMTVAITPKKSTIKSTNTLNYAFTFFKTDGNFKIEKFEKNYFSLIQKLKDQQTSEYDIHAVNLQTEIDSDNNNYIKLSTSERDDFNLPRSEVSITMTKELQHTVKKSVENLQKDIINLGGVLIRTTDNPSFFMGGAHPMGTTKMGRDQFSGVVDKNGKIFGIDNGYICSGSTFATGGYANPTFTLVCMALNLSQFLLKA